MWKSIPATSSKKNSPGCRRTARSEALDKNVRSALGSWHGSVRRNTLNATPIYDRCVFNALSYRIRPYEVRPGATDEAIKALRRCRHQFEAVQVDWLQAKPKVMIIGEFWAMTTEGDGNHQLQRFLEAQGAEVEIQLVTSWLFILFGKTSAIRAAVSICARRMRWEKAWPVAMGSDFFANYGSLSAYCD
jgi:hypothetical protein